MNEVDLLLLFFILNKHEELQVFVNSETTRDLFVDLLSLEVVNSEDFVGWRVVEKSGVA